MLGAFEWSNFLKRATGTRRDEIISAATDLFFQYGYEKASLRNLARKVGVTQAAIYYHFKNKEEILYSIIEGSSKQLIFLLQMSFSGKKDPVEKLRDAILQHVLSIKRHRKGAKIIIEDKRFLSGELQVLVKENEKIIFNLYKNHLYELQETGRIKDGDLTVATFGILGMINWLYHWYKPNKGLSLEQLGERMISILFHGLLTEPD